jgi:ankyrin repeat protein
MGININELNENSLQEAHRASVSEYAISRGITNIIAHAIAKETTKVIELLDHDSDLITILCPFGCTLLHIAVENNDLVLFNKLIQKDQIQDVINIQNISGDTALHEAIYLQRVGMVKKIIDQGADIHLKNIDNESAYELLSQHIPGFN